GGKVEPGEAPDEAIRREIREETGLTLQRLELRLVTAETGPHPAYNWLLFLFRAPPPPARPGPASRGSCGGSPPRSWRRPPSPRWTGGSSPGSWVPPTGSRGWAPSSTVHRAS